MENILVSVVVVTYNSEETVIETLDSIKEQSYQNIELIITDDCSKDNTVSLCETWVKENKNRFNNTLIIKSEQNTGVSANCNRGNLSANGEWIKEIAGDDILLPNCIQDNINYIKKHERANIVFSNCLKFRVQNQQRILGKEILTEQYKNILNSDSKTQLSLLYKHNFLPAVSCFVRTSYFKSSPYNEKYRNLEDYPYWFKSVKKGEKLYYFDSVTVLYRESETLSQSKKKFFNKRLYLDLKYFYYTEIFDDLKNTDETLLRCTLKERFLEDFCMYILKNKNNYFTRKIRSIIKYLFL